MAVIGYGALVAQQPQRMVARGEPIQQDDFTYTVVGVARAKTIGIGSAKVIATGEFTIVTVRVDNQALRVAFRWDPSMVYVEGDDLAPHQLSLTGQRALDAQQAPNPIVEHGTSAQFEVA